MFLFSVFVYCVLVPFLVYPFRQLCYFVKQEFINNYSIRLSLAFNFCAVLILSVNSTLFFLLNRLVKGFHLCHLRFLRFLRWDSVSLAYLFPFNRSVQFFFVSWQGIQDRCAHTTSLNLANSIWFLVCDCVSRSFDVCIFVVFSCSFRSEYSHEKKIR